MVVAEQGIRIEDLADPVLTDTHRRELEFWERHPVNLTEDTVLEAACDEACLYDFGQDGFRERLGYWLELVASESDRTALGRAMIFQRCVRYAIARLRLEDLVHRHPEIHDVQITRPIIVVGPQRSGTTHLVNLLAADSRLRSLPLWEAYEPIPAPEEPATRDGVDARFVRCRQEWEQTQVLLPHMASMHPLEPGHIHDEIELQGPNFASCLLDSMAIVYRERRVEDIATRREHYAYMKTMLKALQWQHGPHRWVLKSPDHCDQLGQLMETFPDATVALTHRDPLAAVQSAATMMAYYARLSYRRVDIDAVAAYWTSHIETLVRGIVDDHHLIPGDRVVDVVFGDFMANKLATVERIYAAAGLELTPDQRDRMVRFLAQHPRHKHGRVVSDLVSCFGVSPEQVRQRFAFYYERYPIQVEDAT